MGTEPQEQQPNKPQGMLSGLNLQPLIEWGKQFRGFLGIVAFILVVFLALITYLFSQGSFSQVLSGFGRLTGDQFLTVVYLVLGLPFIIILLLIILSFWHTRPQKEQEMSIFYVQVYDAGSKERLAQTKVYWNHYGSTDKTTDIRGEAIFTYPTAHKGQKCKVEATKEGYQSKSKVIELGREANVQLYLTSTDKQSFSPQMKQEVAQKADKEVERAAFQLSDTLLLFNGHLNNHLEHPDETPLFHVQIYYRELKNSLDKLHLPIKISPPTTDAELQKFHDDYSLDKLILQIGQELRLQHSPRAESIFHLHTQALVYTAAEGIISNLTLAVMEKGVRYEAELLGLKAALIETFLENPKPNLQPLLDELEKSFQA